MSKDEFSEKIGRLTRSKTYLQFCKEVYGYNEYLFNMMDREQIDFVLNSIPISSEDTILDLGCGSGGILNLLVAKYRCHGIGIDQLDRDILKTHGKTTYIRADIDRISNCNLKPSIILSIDSLYFSKDLNHLVMQLVNTGSQKMYFFYSQYLFDEETGDKNILRSNNTKIAEALRNNGIPFRTIDYSKNERILYNKSLEALQKYKEAFEAEGNADLYEQKYKEDLLGMELYQKGLASRYLYIID
ncbi:MAG TPA: class I SAM-dependent methyltransferase [Clostridiales bacterium]|jgi:trans-aconitate methyltransferase|nr:class I SAM-dependent methyltransferase [Clostridiales bacterium]